MYSLISILQSLLSWARLGGILLITLIGMAVLISGAAQSRLSPGRVLTITGSALLAAALLWMLPALINDVSSGVNSVAPYTPGGGYGPR